MIAPSRAVAAPRQRLPYLRENPAFLDAAAKLGTVVLCTICSEVVGVGTSVDNARAKGLQERSAVEIEGEVFCPKHAAEWWG